MNTPDRIQQLLSAVEAVQDVLDACDLTREQCPTCKLNHFPNWSEYQDAQQLAGASRRLLKVAGALAVNDEATQHLKPFVDRALDRVNDSLNRNSRGNK